MSSRVPMILIVDPERCTGCRTCESVCSFYHYKEFNPRRSRIVILRDAERGVNLPMVCQQCEEAPCIAACPTGATYREEETGPVLIDYEKCIGCKTCITVCPFGGNSLDYVTHKPIKCDLCGGDPECVKYCIDKAIEYVPVTVFNVMKKKRSLEKISSLIELILPRATK